MAIKPNNYMAINGMYKNYKGSIILCEFSRNRIIHLYIGMSNAI